MRFGTESPRVVSLPCLAPAVAAINKHKLLISSRSTQMAVLLAINTPSNMCLMRCQRCASTYDNFRIDSFLLRTLTKMRKVVTALCRARPTTLIGSRTTATVTGTTHRARSAARRRRRVLILCSMYLSRTRTQERGKAAARSALRSGCSPHFIKSSHRRRRPGKWRKSRKARYWTMKMTPMTKRSSVVRVRDDKVIAKIR